MPRTGGGFSVTWQKYCSVMASGFSQLQQNAEFVDMTIAADGHFIRVHQMVVGLASPFLKELIRSTPTPHPVVFLNNVSHKVLCCILEFIYTGEVVVPADLLRNFIEVGKSLHIRGLEDMLADVTAQDTKEMEQVVQDQVIESVQETYEVLEEGQHDMEMNVRGDAEVINTTVYAPNKPVPKATSQYGKAHTLTKKRDMPTVDTIPSKLVKKEEELDQSNSQAEIIQEEYLDTDETHQPEEIAEKPQSKTEMMFTVSNMGGLQMILNRYIFRIRSIYKDGRRRWQCVDENKKCRAQAITKDNKLLSRTALHNHPFHDKRIMSKVQKKAVFANIEKVGASTSGDILADSD